MFSINLQSLFDSRSIFFADLRQSSPPENFSQIGNIMSPQNDFP